MGLISYICVDVIKIFCVLEGFTGINSPFSYSWEIPGILAVIFDGLIATTHCDCIKCYISIHPDIT